MSHIAAIDKDIYELILVEQERQQETIRLIGKGLDKDSGDSGSRDRPGQGLRTSKGDLADEDDWQRVRRRGVTGRRAGMGPGGNEEVDGRRPRGIQRGNLAGCAGPNGRDVVL